jgi:hypothetical protein
MENETEISADQPTIHPDYLRGIGGWLVVYIVLNVIISFNFLISSIRYIASPRVHLFHMRTELMLILYPLMIAAVFFPSFIAYRLAKVKDQPLLLTRYFLIVFPFGSFTWTLFYPGPFGQYDFSFAIMTALFAGTLLYSLPWFLYFQYSRRVMNTYLFSGAEFPSKIQCPFCLSIILLDENERSAKQAVCPICHKEISYTLFHNNMLYTKERK